MRCCWDWSVLQGRFLSCSSRPIAGVWVDRRNHLRILLATQTLSMLQSFALAWLTLAGVITIPQIIILNALQGIVNALDMPTRQGAGDRAD